MLVHLVLFVNKNSPCSCINSLISRSVRSLSHGGVTGVSVKNCQCCVCFLTSCTCHVFSLVVKGRFTASAYWGYKRAVLFTCKLHDCTLIIPQVGFCLSSWTAGACPLLSEQLTHKEEKRQWPISFVNEIPLAHFPESSFIFIALPPVQCPPQVLKNPQDFNCLKDHSFFSPGDFIQQQYIQLKYSLVSWRGGLLVNSGDSFDETEYGTGWGRHLVRWT